MTYNVISNTIEKASEHLRVSCLDRKAISLSILRIYVGLSISHQNDTKKGKPSTSRGCVSSKGIYLRNMTPHGYRAADTIVKFLNSFDGMIML